MKPFLFLPHTADIKFRAQGKTLEKVFESCVLAVSDYLTSGKKIKDKRKIKVSLSGKDHEEILYLFLDHLIYLLEVEHFVPSHAKIKIKDLYLDAAVHGEDIGKNVIKQIKAATYAEMYIKKGKSGWEAQVVMDV